MIYGALYTFRPIDKNVIALIEIPNWVLSDLINLPFAFKVKSLVSHERTMGNNDPFSIYFVMMLCDAIDQGTYNIFLSQLRRFIYKSDQFDPMQFKTVFNALSFSSRMDYKTFLQKISTDIYGHHVWRMIECKRMSKPQVKSFSRIDDLKDIMRNLAVDNWILSKYAIGTHIIAIHRERMLLLKVYSQQYSEICARFMDFISGLKLAQFGDYVLKDRHLYRRIEIENTKIVNEKIPNALRHDINNAMWVVIDEKQLYLRDLQIVTFAFIDRQGICMMNLNIHIPCLYGNRLPIAGRWH